MDLEKDTAGKHGFHVVLSYGDVFRQSGYRTRVLAELDAYDRLGPRQTVLIAFDRDSERVCELPLGSVQLRAHSRRAVLAYYQDLLSLSRQGPIKLVHAHNLYSAAMALSARRAFGYKVVLDLHGRIPEEYAHLKKGRPISYRILNQLEARVVRGADHIVVVSHKLKDYLVSTYAISAQKLTVIPMCADGQTFRCDKELRLKQRAALGLQDRFVCVHLGSFFVWYDPELIVRALERIRRHTPSAHLLVVTGDVTRVRDYLGARMPAEAFTVKSVPHAEVPQLLAAADLGFLLLPSTPNILVSSPAKFSEYLNAGIPVLITPGVGDFSQLTAKAGIGMVTNDEGDFEVSLVDGILRSREEFAVRCANAGQALTWQAHQPEWTRIVGSLLD